MGHADLINNIRLMRSSGSYGPNEGGLEAKPLSL
jgi:hypothetical protein